MATTPKAKAVGRTAAAKAKPANPKAKAAPAQQEPKKLGRPSSFDQAVADEIIERLSIGEPLAQICRDEAMPAVRTVSDWKAANAAFSADFARAREEGFDFLAADTLTIIDTKPERTLTAEGDKVDTGHVAWLKNRAEQRLKLLAKWDPKRYGDKIDLNHGGQEGNPVQVKTKVVMVPLKQVAETMTRKLTEEERDG
jgi:hypothetical protein